ncbi:granulocyte-macrophage colony-stimulating factor receptor subunit alpha isoform X2 [Xenopus tropicalis]|uniref:Granulocyte-macrophage colony-stimulating factor receptor subunit alpha n=1 Tax=Xenopus tropicalis TaxID=8364 RepID=A0A803JJJ7_XENTR|nr:granulocyte-macrophage colony-stimulating factor receptor subunit alpha isoform X2 [Xenopus tropicalis]
MAWTLFILCTLQYMRTITAQEVSPLHVKIKNGTVKPAYISITWDCNITEEMKNYKYSAVIKDKKTFFPHDIDINNCSTEFLIGDFVFLNLHEGVSVKIKANNKETENIKWTTFYPEGENQTSAENVGCIVHGTVVNCLWDFGKKAPKDTIYSLWLYQSHTWEECQDYKTDLAARQMHCSFKVLRIQYKLPAYLFVEGSSNTTSILFYDQWITLSENEILMPPRNILINASTHGVEIKWEKPETHTYYSDHCFKYEITLKEEKMQDKTYNVDKKLHFTVHEFTSNQQFQLKVRAKRNFGCSDTKWSTWSETSKFVPSAGPLTHTHLFILLAIGTVIAVTALIYVCHRFQVLKKVFPPIPAPVIKLQSLDQDELKELQENLTSASEKLPDNEDIKICEIDNYAEDIYFEKIFK